jgi:tRNA pseudouridine55 synthase
MVFGLFLIDKPAGPTSHDIVAQIRRGIGERRVGHAGTLDPLASGLLIVAVGQATRLVEYLVASKKWYEARILLGAVSSTYDREGVIRDETALPDTLNRQAIESALDGFVGEILQRPPIYSAVKVAGKSAHARARDGQTFELEPRPVTITSLRLTSIDLPTITVEVECSPGTYIRSLAHDLGQALGCGALLDGLIRTRSGSFDLSEAIVPSLLNESFLDHTWQQYLLEADRALSSASAVILKDDDVQRVVNGVAIPRHSQEGHVARAYTLDGRFFAVLTADPAKSEWRPHKVFSEQVASFFLSKH